MWIDQLIVLPGAVGYRERDLNCHRLMFHLAHLEKNVSLEIPEYSEVPMEINGNEPDFSKSDLRQTHETYSELDSLGRCGAAYANVGQNLMPTGREAASDR